MLTETTTLHQAAPAPYRRPPWLKRPPLCPQCRRAVRDGDIAILAKTQTTEFAGSGYKTAATRHDWTVTHAECR